ncbi:MAG TPA: S-layer homology domain-containing protein [Thermoanaerobaculia bacterium]|nr:S-layer homology domain-containing protein [Thermoanaerobaculia bacterium]
MRLTLHATAVLAVCSLLPARPACAASPDPFRETGAAIEARQKAADAVQGPRPAPPRLLARGRAARHAAESTRPVGSLERPVALPRAGAPQTLGVSFLGAHLADANSFPPDTSGAVGPTQFLVGVNGRLRSFDKTTGSTDGGLNADTDTFFNSVRNGVPTFAPRVRFDRISGRWFVSALSFATSALASNRVLLAVSSSGTISNGTIWTFFYFEHDLDLPTGDTGDFFDVGSLGIDANAAIIGGNVFDETSAYVGTSIHAVRKSTLLNGPGGDLAATGDAVAYRNLTGTPDGAGPYTPQGLNNSSDAAPAASWVIGVNNVLPVTSQLVLRELTFGGPGTWPPTALSANTMLDVPTTALPLTVPHLGNTGGSAGELDALDDRLFDAKGRGSRVWTAHNIAVDATGTGSDAGDRDAVRWYEIDLTGGTPTLVQSGTLFDDAASNPRFYWMPSVMVSGQGHAAVGASAAGAAERVNAVAAGRLASDPPGTLAAPLLYTASTTAYNPAADPGPPRRWGDYSFTSLDPDDMTLWTIQEYCDAADSWGVRVAQLLAPPPATPVSATPSTVASGQASVSVVVSGVSTAGAAFYDPGPGYASRLSASLPGGVTVNGVTFTDATTATLDLNTVGAPFGGRTITMVNPDGQSRASAAPILTLAAAGPGPTVSSIAPDSGDASTPQALVLTGTAFVSGASVTVGGVGATGVDVTDPTSAGATTPVLSPGTLNDVTLVNPDTQSATLYAAWFADFLDVPAGDAFHDYVETIFRNGVTAGCSGGNYCRNDSVTRAQMAVFLLKSRYGSAYAPPGCAGLFGDVACPSLFADWIEDLYAQGVTGGCSTSPLLYCPGQAVTRAQMAVFLLKGSLGSSYAPPNCTGQVFTDVPCTGGSFDPWIEDLANRGITGGCGGGNYCPASPVTRGQMAVFLTKAFSLP